MVKQDRLGRAEQPVNVLLQLEDPAVVGADALEDAVAVEQPVVEDRNLRVAPRRNICRQYRFSCHLSQVQATERPRPEQLNSSCPSLRKCLLEPPREPAKRTERARPRAQRQPTPNGLAPAAPEDRRPPNPRHTIDTPETRQRHTVDTLWAAFGVTACPARTCPQPASEQHGKPSANPLRSAAVPAAARPNLVRGPANLEPPPRARACCGWDSRAPKRVPRMLTHHAAVGAVPAATRTPPTKELQRILK